MLAGSDSVQSDCGHTGRLYVTHSYLDVLAEEVGIETQPVSGNVEPALQKNISEESAGVH